MSWHCQTCTCVTPEVNGYLTFEEAAKLLQVPPSRLYTTLRKAGAAGAALSMHYVYTQGFRHTAFLEQEVLAFLRSSTYERIRFGLPISATNSSKTTP